MNYQSFHEEDKITFHCQQNVFFGQCTPQKKISLNELLKITSNVAVEEYRRRGLSREFLKENGFAILVSRCSFRIHKMPAENQFIEVVTWEEKPEALQLIRCYEILDEEKNILVSGKSSWILVDINLRRILPTKKFTLREPSPKQVNLNCDPPAKISVDENLPLLDERKIKFSDLDANGHTTNPRYAAFIEDVLPAELRTKDVKDFKINFAKEALLDDTLKIFGAFDRNKNQFVVEGKTEKAVSFESILQF
jgi:acyl-ACP thioesterase